jgi:hypothetical protein
MNNIKKKVKGDEYLIFLFFRDNLHLEIFPRVLNKSGRNCLADLMKLFGLITRKFILLMMTGLLAVQIVIYV